MAAAAELARPSTDQNGPETDAFTRELQTRGGAVIDLCGDASVLALCDAVAAESRRFELDGYNRVQDLWRQSPAVRALASLPAVTEALARAYGVAPFPFQTLNFVYGSQQKPHADSVHFTAEPPHLMCGVWFALEDVSADAGPVEYYPGSHTQSVMSLTEAGAPAEMDRQEAYVRYYEPAVAARIAAIKPETVLLKKGQAFVWAANLVHGGAPRRSPTATRRSQVTHYFFRGASYYTLMRSRPGRRDLRLPADLRTGRFVWPRRQPGDVLSARTIAGAFYRRAANTVLKFKG